MGITGIDHLVIRVKDLEEGIRTYRDKLGMELERTGENEAIGIKQAFFPLADGGYIEIVAPLGPETPVGKAIESSGEGLHTVAMAVDDLEASVKAMQEAGVRLIGVGGPQVFIHPKSAHGLLVYLMEKN